MTFCHKGGYMKNRDLCFFGKIGTEKAKKKVCQFIGVNQQTLKTHDVFLKKLT